MSHCLSSLVIAAIMLQAVNVQAQQEGNQSSAEEQMAKLVALGPGVHKIIKDKKGRITSCVVVGQARISTALGKAKGLELARDKANLTCSAEFVKWLKEEVTVVQTSDEEAVILVEGTESADDDSLKETGKALEKNSKKMESVSKGLIRGLQILHKEVDGDGKTYAIVKGWKADTAEGVKKISADLASDEPASKLTKAKSSSPAKERTSKKIDKEIESGSKTSDDAADFLPKQKK